MCWDRVIDAESSVPVAVRRPQTAPVPSPEPDQPVELVLEEAAA